MSYLETRYSATGASLATDIAHHLQRRQHLGKAIIICDKPTIFMSMVRKQWFKIARSLQKERAGTINAEKILRLTNSITHMHNMTFVSKPPEQLPYAHAYFVSPEQLGRLLLPLNTYSIYVTGDLAAPELAAALEQLPPDALLIDYTKSLANAPLQPKHLLEEQVREHWTQISNFLARYNITIEAFAHPGHQNTEATDDALDILLGVSHHFLQLASTFQHVFELAQPFMFPNIEQRQYDTVMLLAHRVQALNPTAHFSTQFTYNLAEDETFFLHDIGAEAGMASLLAHAVQRHREAGRTRLARALAFSH